MRQLLIIGVATTAVFVTAVPQSAATPSLGEDKLLHFGVSLSLSSAGYWFGASITESRLAPFFIGGGFALAAGLGKELWDLSGGGEAEWLDLAFDLMGSAVGLLIAWTVHRVYRSMHPSPEGGAAYAPTR